MCVTEWDHNDWHGKSFEVDGKYIAVFDAMNNLVTVTTYFMDERITQDTEAEVVVTVQQYRVEHEILGVAISQHRML